MGFRKRLRRGDKIVTANGVVVEIEAIGFDSIEVFLSAPKGVKIDTPMGAETKALKEAMAIRKAGKTALPQPVMPQPVKWKPIDRRLLNQKR